jgi:hypothetical protein
MVINELFEYMEKILGIVRTGYLYGRKDSSEGRIEISGFDAEVLGKKYTQQARKKPIGNWISLEKPVDKIKDLVNMLGKVGDLILLLPPKIENLANCDRRYGFYFKDRSGVYQGPLGYLIFGEKDFVIPTGLEVNAIEAGKSTPGIAVNSEQKTKRTRQTSRSIIATSRTSQMKDTSNADRQKIVVGSKDNREADIEVEKRKNSMKIKIDKEQYERYRNLDFFRDCEYHTPKDYIFAFDEDLQECSDSIFLYRGFLIKLIAGQRDILRRHDYLFTNFEGTTKIAADETRVYQSKSRVGGILTSHQVMHPELIRRRLHDKRTSYRLRFWCLYTRHERFKQHSNFELFKSVLLHTKSSRTEIGVVIREIKKPQLNLNYFDSDSFDMCAFIREIDSHDILFFPRDRFFVYYDRK